MAHGGPLRGAARGSGRLRPARAARRAGRTCCSPRPASATGSGAATRSRARGVARPGRAALPVARPGGCGGCDWQHAALAAPAALEGRGRRRAAARGSAGPTVDGLVGRGRARDADGLGWRTRVRYAVDAEGRAGLRRHRSHDVVAIAACPIADPRWTRSASRPGAGPGAGGGGGRRAGPATVERLVVVEPTAGTTAGGATAAGARRPRVAGRPGPAASSACAAGLGAREVLVEGRPRLPGRPAQASGRCTPAPRRRCWTPSWTRPAAAAGGARAGPLLRRRAVRRRRWRPAVGPDGLGAGRGGRAAGRRRRPPQPARPALGAAGRTPRSTPTRWRAPDRPGRADVVVLDPPRTGAGREWWTAVAALRAAGGRVRRLRPGGAGAGRRDGGVRGLPAGRAAGVRPVPDDAPRRVRGSFVPARPSAGRTGSPDLLVRAWAIRPFCVSTDAETAADGWCATPARSCPVILVREIV